MAKSFDWVKKRATDGSQGKRTTTIINNTPRAKEIKAKVEYSLSPSSNECFYQGSRSIDMLQLVELLFI